METEPSPWCRIPDLSACTYVDVRVKYSYSIVRLSDIP